MNKKIEYLDGFSKNGFRKYAWKPAGEITVIRTQDEIMFVDDLNPDIISVHPSNTRHTDETEEEYLKRLYNDKPYVLDWIKKWKEQGLY